MRSLRACCDLDAIFFPACMQNSELFTLTYGAVVTQLIRDFEDPVEVTKQLELMGYNIGVRLIEEFCAKNRGARCRTFRETIDTVAREGFRMFLGCGAVVDGWNAASNSCVLRLPENPLADFVELPPAYSDLRYSSIICGVIRGALDSVSDFPCSFHQVALSPTPSFSLLYSCLCSSLWLFTVTLQRMYSTVTIAPRSVLS
jgi:trafficking protein particle complex subunit 3